MLYTNKFDSEAQKMYPVNIHWKLKRLQAYISLKFTLMKNQINMSFHDKLNHKKLNLVDKFAYLNSWYSDSKGKKS